MPSICLFSWVLLLVTQLLRREGEGEREGMRARDRELEIEIEEKDKRGEEKRDPCYVRRGQGHLKS